MRFKNPSTTCHNGREYREKTFFAWLPINLDDEIRWLETVTVEQVWTEVGSSGCKELYTHQYVCGWESLKFVN